MSETRDRDRQPVIPPPDRAPPQSQFAEPKTPTPGAVPAAVHTDTEAGEMWIQL